MVIILKCKYVVGSGSEVRIFVGLKEHIISFGSNFHIYSDFRSSRDGKYNEVTAFCTRRNEIF